MQFIVRFYVIEIPTKLTSLLPGRGTTNQYICLYWHEALCKLIYHFNVDKQIIFDWTKFMCESIYFICVIYITTKLSQMEINAPISVLQF